MGYALENFFLKLYLITQLQTNTIGFTLQYLRSITVLGVVEDTLVSSLPTEVARYVGKRTVYRFDEIESLCQREVLAILFRQAWILKNPITLKNLVTNGVITSAPQSIVTVPEEGVKWLQTRLDI